MSNWVKTNAIKKMKFGKANHGDIINLKTLTNGIPWINPHVSIDLTSLEIEGNTKRVYVEAQKLDNDRFKIVICSTTATSLADIAKSGVSTKYGSGVWLGFESD